MATMLIMVGCGGTTQVNTEINIPDLDKTTYTDTPYEEGWKNLKAGKPAQALGKAFSSDASLEYGELAMALCWLFLLDLFLAPVSVEL